MAGEKKCTRARSSSMRRVNEARKRKGSSVVLEPEIDVTTFTDNNLPEGNDSEHILHEQNVEFSFQINLSDESKVESGNTCMIQVNKNTPRRSLIYRGLADVENTKPPVKPEGRRLWTMQAINTLMTVSCAHGRVCQNARLHIESETRFGLRSFLVIECKECHEKIKVKNDANDCTLPCNRAAVWAGNSTGTGYTDMKHAMAVLDVPFLTFKAYSRLEREFENQIERCSYAQLIENGIEERKLAEELGRIDPDNVVWTEVQEDGGWSKRSYNQKGISLTGSAVIIGLLTGKPLYVDVRNKYCYMCQAKRKGPIPEHECFKNWNGSSCGMETDVIVEGFSKSLEMHNLRYKRYLGDGDSSVFLNIRQIYYDNVNSYKLVDKLECKNHAIRCLNKNLRMLLKQTEYPLAHRKALELRMSSIGKYCVYAIQLAKEGFPAIGVGDLRVALRNCLEHVFGEHQKCQKYICKDGKIVVPIKYKKTEDTASIDTKMFTDKKNATDVAYKILRGTALWEAVGKHIDRLVSMSNSLILGQTTNKAECFQSQFGKFLQGKRKNVSYRGSYKKKCSQIVLAIQYGSGWYSYAFNKCFGKSPSALWERMGVEGLRERESNNKYVRSSRYKRFWKQSVTESDADYGTGANKPDISEEDMAERISDLIKKYQIQSKEDQWNIHLATVGQFGNARYVQERRYMLTASIAGTIYSMKDSTANSSIVEQLLRSKFLGNVATLWGKEHEACAIELYETATGQQVSRAGLFKSLEFSMLAASPDGLVGDEGLVEIKCPFKERNMHPLEVAKRKGTFLRLQKLNGQDSVELKKTSNYYSQVVMQLHITNRSWCDFVVWTQGPVDDFDNPEIPQGLMIKTRIYKSTDTLKVWNLMRPKLTQFFMEDLAPEIVDSRVDRNMKIRQPLYRVEAGKRLLEKKDKTKEMPIRVKKIKSARKLVFDTEQPSKKARHNTQ